MAAESTGRLSLRPIRPAIQRVAVYETRTKMYIVGSTNDGNSCRMLKIDRLTSPSLGLEIEEDEKEYQEHEAKVTLKMLEGANQNSTTKYQSGLQQVASAFGIVATIGGHVLYKIEDTLVYPISSSAGRPTNADESRYLKIFQNVDLSSNFYFSYSYDLTHSLQCQMRTSSGPAPPSCTKFIWNEHMLKHFEGHVHSRWVLHVICGFVSQINISVFGRPIFLTLIARRSKNFAGTRFLKRGANDEGHVANEVETEQIVHDAGTSLHSSGRYTSFLQLRGSVPSFWSQDIASMRPKPQIRIDRAAPFASPAGMHFANCLKRFGSPVICLNLVKLKEKRMHESLLTDELSSSIDYLNQFLPPEHHILYVHKDMARIHKKQKDDNLIAILEEVAQDSIFKTGIFHSGPELHCHQLNPHPKYLKLGGYGYRHGYVGRDQTGLVRVNCVDCLDRTNTAQFLMGKCALGYQLYLLGILDEPHVPFDCDTMRLLEEAYEDLGDSQAVQYGGSTLVHRIQTYRKVAPMKSHGRDIYASTLRYYRNAFTDTDKQMAINVFLGVFEPQEGQPNIWDLSTDYYLHHTTAREPKLYKQLGIYTKWWNEKLLLSLPLPQLQIISQKEELPHPPKESTWDSFDEVYRTYEFTDFDRLLSSSIARTGDSSQDVADANPFVVRNNKTKKKISLKHPERMISVGIPRTNQEKEDSTSDEDEDNEQNNEQTSPNHNDSFQLPHHQAISSYTEPTDLPSCQQYYGFELKEPTSADKETYDRFAKMYQMACVAPTLSSNPSQDQMLILKPLGNYGNDDIYKVTPPTVPDESLSIYNTCCQVARYGPHPPNHKDRLLYDQFIKEDTTSSA